MKKSQGDWNGQRPAVADLLWRDARIGSRDDCSWVLMMMMMRMKSDGEKGSRENRVSKLEL